MTDPPFCVFDHTTTLITAFYLPSFVAFTSAINTNINYVLPNPPPSFVYMNGTATTFVINLTSRPQVVYSWLTFAGLFFFGCVMASIILAAHASYHEWPSRHPSHHHVMHAKLLKARQREQEEQNKKFDRTFGAQQEEDDDDEEV